MAELKLTGGFTKMSEQAALSHAANERMATVVSREKAMAAAVRQLDKDLTEEKASHGVAIAAQKAAIARLKEELQAVKSAAQVETRYARKTERGSTTAVGKTQGAASSGCRDRIGELEEKLRVEDVCHEETVSFLSRKTGALHAELERWSERFDAEVGAKERECEALREKQLAGRERLDALQGRKARDDAEAAAAAAAKQAAADAAEAEAKMDAARCEAARVIQVVARAYLVRKAAADAAGGKKKKGGKKGKKKK